VSGDAGTHCSGAENGGLTYIHMVNEPLLND
jgi:hypothetical protein